MIIRSPFMVIVTALFITFLGAAGYGIFPAYAQGTTTPAAVTPPPTPGQVGPISPTSMPGAAGVTAPNSVPPEVRDRTRARLVNLAANLSTRFENTHLRLSDIHRRMEARRVLLQAGGADTARAAEALAQASSTLARVGVKLAQIDAEVAMTAGAVDASLAWSGLRETYTTMHSEIGTAHTILTQALAALKPTTSTVTSPSATGTAITN